MPAPIAFFAFNRPDHTRRALEALSRNRLADQSELFIFIDGPRGERDLDLVSQTVAVCKAATGFKTLNVTSSEVNRGAGAAIISGTTQVIEQFGSVVVMEDDLITSPHCLNYLNSGLEFYRDVPEVMTISAYTPPEDKMPFPPGFAGDMFFNLRNSSWGWGTWKDRWDSVDWDVKDFRSFKQNRRDQKNFNRGGEDLTWMLKDQMNGRIDAWDIRFTYAHYRQQRLSVCPRFSYVNNIGMDGSGTHYVSRIEEEVDVSHAKADPVLRLPAIVDEEVMDSFRAHMAPRFRRRVKRLLIQIGLLN